jgi:hypothetical protein
MGLAIQGRLTGVCVGTRTIDVEVKPKPKTHWVPTHVSRGCKNYSRVARRRTHLWTGGHTSLGLDLFKPKP